MGYVPKDNRGGSAQKNYIAFERARAVVRSMGFSSKLEWLQWRRDDLCPLDMPSDPAFVYRDSGWLSWADFLGFGEGQVPRTVFSGFNEAHKYVLDLGLTSKRQWTEWCASGQRPNTIPACPHLYYRDAGWISWQHWLRDMQITNARSCKGHVWLPFEQARAHMRNQELSSTAEWREWCKCGNRPPNIPSAPSCAYRNQGWISVPDFLGY